MNDLVNTQAAQLPSNPQEMADYYRKMAEAYASTEQTPSNTISIRNGTMSVGDQPIPANQFAAVILDAVRLNTYYPGNFNPNSIEPPRCFAIGRNDAELAPHPDMQKDLEFFKPQAATCNACPMNEFGSGSNGKGKACTNRRRLLMLLAGTYKQTPQGLIMEPRMDPSHYSTTPFLTMHLPPTSLKGWGEFVRRTAADYQRPFSALVTRVFLTTHPTHGKEMVSFEALGPTPDEWFQTLMPRQNDAMREIGEGYMSPAMRGEG